MASATSSHFKAMPRTGSYFEPLFDDRRDYLDDVLRVEFQTKMVNDFLVNEDRVTSAHGVEGRVGFEGYAAGRVAFQQRRSALFGDILEGTVSAVPEEAIGNAAIGVRMAIHGNSLGPTAFVGLQGEIQITDHVEI